MIFCTPFFLLSNRLSPATLVLMKIAIVGAGFAGLTAAWELRKKGHQVSVYEADDKPGGLAAGFPNKEWNWTLEKHYHHIFTSDKDIISLAEEMELSEKLIFKKVKTSTRYKGCQFPLDSALSLLTCPVLGFSAKFRTGLTLAYLRLFPYQPWMENVSAKDFLIKTMGKESWKVLWQPLFEGKFGTYATTVNAAWFWARIHVRSAQLGYFKQGFLSFAEQIVDILKQNKVSFSFNTRVNSIKKVASQFLVETTTGDKTKQQTFDRVLVAAPAPVLTAVAKNVSAAYKKKITALESLGAVTLILELNDEFFPDQTYWLNVNEKKWPFLAVVEHTHFMPAEHYGDKTLLYVGKYCEPNSELFKMKDDQLLNHYLPYLKILNPKIKKLISRSWVFREKFAQPIVGRRHRQKVPKITTPVPGLFWASMQHVYPWDRGTNYAVQIGRSAAQLINDSL